jgi:uncharacterized protein (DUF486 family)
MGTVLKTVGLLLLSNIFMTFAWYGHLKNTSKPLMITIITAWGIAFFEYCMQVPANRIGHSVMTTPQLKILQEAITFVVFIVFTFFYLKEKPSLYDYVSMLLIFAAVAISLSQPRAA